MVSRALVAVLAMIGLLLVAPAVLPRAGAQSDAGTVGAALAWSAERPAGQTGTALLGRADAFADALASGVAQGRLQAPLLLTPSTRLDERVAAELVRLGVTRVVLLGGESAISTAVADALAADGYAVDRVAGPTRIETAVAIAAAVAPSAQQALIARAAGTPDNPTAAFADALAAGAPAARLGLPVLLTEQDRLSPATAAYLSGSAVRAVTVVGGTGAVGEPVLAQLRALGVQVERVAGSDRFATAAAVAGRFPATDPAGTTVVDGAHPDAWAGGFAAALRGAEVLLTAFDRVPRPTLDRLWARHRGVSCGSLVAADACAQARAADSVAPLEGGGSLVAFLDGTAGPAGEGTGRATVRRTGVPGAVCVTALDHDLVFPPTAVEVREGPPGSGGAVLLRLAQGGHFARGCLLGVGDAVDALFADPGGHHVTLPSADFPGGALSGPLGVPAEVRVAALPDPATGSTDPRAGVVLLGVGGQTCAALNLDLLAAPAVGASVHTGPPGVSGPITDLPVGPRGGSAAGCRPIAVPGDGVSVQLDTTAGAVSAPLTRP